MITAEEQIAAILDPVFNGELYPVVHPDPDGTTGSVAQTYAIYAKIGGAVFTKLDGVACLSRVRMQVSIYSTSYADLKTKETAVNTAMEAANQLASTTIDAHNDPFDVLGALANVSSSVPADGFEDDTRRYFIHATFYCWGRS